MSLTADQFWAMRYEEQMELLAYERLREQEELAGFGVR